jgi:uncharacterized repeat protein (TIGR03803 family)
MARFHLFRLVALSAVLSAIVASVVPAAAQTWTPTDLYNFTDTGDGAFPVDNLIQAHDGNYYGTARSVYKISPSGAFTVLNGKIFPTGPVVEGPDGLLYGACGQCGTSGNSAIFSMTTAGVAKILYTFTGGNDGSGPSPLILGTDGNYWGTTYAGGSGMIGTIFKITPAGALTTVYAFPSDGSQGYDPTGIALVQASDGKFYGAVTQTPPNEIILGQPTRPNPLVNRARPHVEPTPSFTDGGIIFSISTTGGFASAYAFGANDGNDPNVSLVEGQNGKLYGETAYGTAGYGNIFTLAVGGGSGNYSTLYNFTGTADAGTPEGPLFLASDGNFYGSASGAVANTGEGGAGAIFKLTPSGTFSVLNFTDSNNGNPDSSLLQGSDGNFYGTFDTLGSFAGECDEFGCGSVFKLTPSTKLAAPVQLSFSSSTTAPGTAVTLNWKVLNAFSDTLQLCYAYQSAAAAGSWTGKQKGTLSSSTHLYTGSAQVTPTADGTYTYALTCGGQESGSATLTVSGKGKDDSTTTLTASPNPATIGQSVTLKATVAGSGATPSGSVSYDVGTTVLTSVSLNGSGVASFTASTNGEGAGVYPVTADYAGNSTYDASNSSTVNVTLNKAPTSTALTASPTSVTPPASVTLTATVKRSTSGAVGNPTGSVTFSVGSTTLATVKLSGGVATLKASSAGQSAGSYPITAKYTGDSSDIASTSSTVSVTVK